MDGEDGWMGRMDRSVGVTIFRTFLGIFCGIECDPGSPRLCWFAEFGRSFGLEGSALEVRVVSLLFRIAIGCPTSKSASPRRDEQRRDHAGYF